MLKMFEVWGISLKCLTHCQLYYCNIHPHLSCPIRYRPASDEEGTGGETASSPKKTKSEKQQKHSPKSKKDELWIGV